MTGKFIITRDHLAELGACADGMDFYDNQEKSMEYTQELKRLLTIQTSALFERKNAPRI